MSTLMPSPRPTVRPPAAVAPAAPQPGRRGERHPAPPPPKLVPVAPRGELRPQRFPDAHQREALRVTGKADVVGGNAEVRVPEDPLAVLDGLPALFQRREVPAFALAADDPEEAAGGVERETASHGERLDNLVGAEGLAAENTGPVHGFSAFNPGVR